MNQPIHPKEGITVHKEYTYQPMIVLNKDNNNLSKLLIRLRIKD